MDLTTELLEPSPPSSPKSGETLEQVLDLILTDLHKAYVQSLPMQRSLGENCFPYDLMKQSLLEKAKIVQQSVSVLSAIVTATPLPQSQAFKFSSETEKQRFTIAVAPQQVASQPPLLNRLLSVSETQIVLEPAETRQLAGLILGAIRDSSSDIYRKQVAEAQEKLTKMGQDVLRYRERLRAKEELILNLELKLAGKSKSLREGNLHKD